MRDNIQEPKITGSEVVCVDCGLKYLTDEQKKRGGVTTFHEGECFLCGQTKPVTSIRHYNYLNQTNQS